MSARLWERQREFRQAGVCVAAARKLMCALLASCLVQVMLSASWQWWPSGGYCSELGREWL